VHAGVAADFGSGLKAIQREAIVSVLGAAPRDGFVQAFLGVVAAFVRENPDSAGSSWVADVGLRLVPGFHAGNFVDDVTASDPFQAYR
jgi:hypothetical protein